MTTRNVAFIAGAAAGAAVIVVVLVMIANAILGPDQTGSNPPVTPGPTPSWNPSAGDAGEDHEDGPAEVQEAAWGPVAEHFARNFPRTQGGAKKWRQRLIGPTTAPYVTGAVADQLQTVDIDRVPKGRYQRRETLETSAYNVAVGVQYKEGWGMVLYLQTDGVDWQIYAYDQWEP